MAQRMTSFETTYSELLAAYWEEFEDLLDTYCSGPTGDGPGIDRIRLKFGELCRRLARLLEQAESQVREGALTAQDAMRVRAFAVELTNLLGVDVRDEAADLTFGPTMVRAQHRILDEARRLALAT